MRASTKLFVQALPLVILVRLALWVLPSGMTVRLVARVAGRAREASAARQRAARAIGQAVHRAAAYVPSASCLTQAVACQLLLTRYRLVSRLSLGVAKTPTGALQAHAWVECAGVVVVGGDKIERYVPLPAIDTAQPEVHA